MSAVDRRVVGQLLRKWLGSRLPEVLLYAGFVSGHRAGIRCGLLPSEHARLSGAARTAACVAAMARYAGGPTTGPVQRSIVFEFADSSPTSCWSV